MHLEHLLLLTTAYLIIVSVENAFPGGRVSFATNVRSSFPPSSPGTGYWHQQQQKFPVKSSLKIPFKQSMQNSNGMHFLMQQEFHQRPRSKPKTKPALAQETSPSPPAVSPVSEPTTETNTEPWDKKMLIEHVIAAYKDSCKSSDIVIFSPEARHKLVASAKKMPVVVDDFPWVMNVEMFCTLNFWRVHSCFSMPLEEGFKKAMAIHGINFTENRLK